MKDIFCLVYRGFLVRFVDSEKDWLVRLMNAVAGSKCKYCFGIRMFLLGVSVCAPFAWSIALCTLVGFFTWGEAKWLCVPKGKK